MTNYKNRDVYIDAIRGAAILLVVLGHSIQTNVDNFDDNLLFRIIYSFHMPLFIFLSGFVTWNRVGSSKVDWITKKFYALIVPYFVWLILYYFIGGIGASFGSPENSNFISYITESLLYPDKGLWFLWVLFSICVIFRLSLTIAAKFGDVSLFFVAALLHLIPVGIFGIGLIKWYFLFFVLGYLFAKYRSTFKTKSALQFFLVITFFLLVFGWKRNSTPLYYNWLNETLSSFGLNISNLEGLLSLAYDYTVGILGVASLFIILKYLTFTYKYLAYFGLISLEIYTSHYLFLNLGVGQGTFKIITTFIITIMFVLLLKTIIYQVPLMPYFLFGNSKYKPGSIRKGAVINQ